MSLLPSTQACAGCGQHFHLSFLIGHVRSCPPASHRAPAADGAGSPAVGGAGAPATATAVAAASVVSVPAPAPVAAAAAVVVVVPSARKCGHCGGVGHDKRNCPSGGMAAERKCGQCGEPGHDRRGCPSKPAAPAAPSASHLSAMSRVITGPARPNDPAAFWAALGADSGSYPFQRDAHGALHLPLVCMGNGGSAAARAALALMPEYAWDAVAKVYRRTCPCPGCH